MGRLAAAVALTGFAMLGGAAPLAAAEPADLVPYCSGDQTPMDTNRRVPASQIFTHDGSGVNPDLPFGLDPGNDPAI